MYFLAKGRADMVGRDGSVVFRKIVEGKAETLRKIMVIYSFRVLTAIFFFFFFFTFAGSYFGEVALFSAMHECSIRASTECHLYVLGRRALRKLAQDFPSIIVSLKNRAKERSRRLQRTMRKKLGLLPLDDAANSKLDDKDGHHTGNDLDGRPGPGAMQQAKMAEDVSRMAEVMDRLAAAVERLGVEQNYLRERFMIHD
jgi:CRP-like cAMP-binding protein